MGGERGKGLRLLRRSIPVRDRSKDHLPGPAPGVGGEPSRKRRGLRSGPVLHNHRESPGTGKADTRSTAQARGSVPEAMAGTGQKRHSRDPRSGGAGRPGRRRAAGAGPQSAKRPEVRGPIRQGRNEAVREPERGGYGPVRLAGVLDQPGRGAHGPAVSEIRAHAPEVGGTKRLPPPNNRDVHTRMQEWLHAHPESSPGSRGGNTEAASVGEMGALDRKGRPNRLEAIRPSFEHRGGIWPGASRGNRGFRLGAGYGAGDRAGSEQRKAEPGAPPGGPADKDFGPRQHKAPRENPYPVSSRIGAYRERPPGAPPLCSICTD